MGDLGWMVGALKIQSHGLHRGDYTEQTAITNQLPVVLKDKFSFKGLE